MAELDLIIFDDAVARDWYPFTTTRPAGELLLGTTTLRQRLEGVTGARCRGYLTSAALADFDEADAPRVLDPASLTTTRPTLFLSSRCVLHWDVSLDASSESTLRVADQVAGWVLPAGARLPSEDDVLAPARERGQVHDVGGTLLENVWDLIQHNVAHTASDILHFHPAGELVPRPARANVIGDYQIVCGQDVVIEPGVVFDTSAGPIWLDDEVEVRAFSRIAGPLYAGRKTMLLGGSFSASSFGPHCKLHGEIEASVVLGFSNKAHDGFLGHAYLGRWVNLGAATTNSDLKNNYSTVRIFTPAGEIDTGMIKLGALIGDHAKTAIGTLLTTGTVIGTGANVIEERPPRHVPPFSWGEDVFELEKFLQTAERVMKRRNLVLSAGERALLSRAWRARAAEVAL
jgi:UDP-N-acetylglucosamine diphosphorylase/glucosamine-1-phosphate N-acetyltransferase